MGFPDLMPRVVIPIAQTGGCGFGYLSRYCRALTRTAALQEGTMNIYFGYGRRTVAATLALVGLIVLTGLTNAAQPSEEPPATNLTTVAPPALGKPPAARHHRAKPRVAHAPAVGIRPVASVCAWDGFDWDQLSNAERQAWETLGWSRARWETGKDASSSSRDWSELSDTERNAAGRLGFAADNWNVVCSLWRRRRARRGNSPRRKRMCLGRFRLGPIVQCRKAGLGSPRVVARSLGN